MESDESGSSQNSSRRSSSSNYEEENEEYTAATDSIDHLGDCSGWEPYCDEPMADTNWIVAYQARKQAESDKYTEFKQRLENKLPIENWCKCGHCNVSLLKNPMECYCCAELEECQRALEDEIVVKEVGATLNCITLHPGFKECCLSTWALRLAGTRYKTKQKRKYNVLATDEAYLRAVSYREFTRLIHGILGKRRVPLPACAYFSIRNTFKGSGDFTGFQDEDS